MKKWWMCFGKIVVICQPPNCEAWAFMRELSMCRQRNPRMTFHNIFQTYCQGFTTRGSCSRDRGASWRSVYNNWGFARRILKLLCTWQNHSKVDWRWQNKYRFNNSCDSKTLFYEFLFTMSSGAIKVRKIFLKRFLNERWQQWHTVLPRYSYCSL